MHAPIPKPTTTTDAAIATIATGSIPFDESDACTIGDLRTVEGF